jgi:hypothetical protein
VVTARHFGRSLAALYLTISMVAACSQVLGIEEAHVDPTLDGQGDAGAAAALAQGSSGSASPMASAFDDAGDAVTDAGAGTLCDQYCTAVTAGCADTHSQYIDLAACQASCGYFPEGSPGDTEGNSVNCRLTYAQKASSEPYTYCTWAGPGGDGKCGSNCEGFCTIMMQACTADSTGKAGEYFASANDCETTCAGLEDIGSYSASDASQQRGADDVQCRLYHVGAAVADSDPMTHCPHAMGLSLCAAPARK